MYTFISNLYHILLTDMGRRLDACYVSRLGLGIAVSNVVSKSGSHP